MKTAKNCLKNSKCQLWQVLCDGNPCIVDTEIASHSTTIPKGPKMWHLSRLQSGEIIELAEKIEKMGSQFFKKLAKTTSNRQIKNLLLYLAAEEKQHQVRFRELGKVIDELITEEQIHLVKLTKLRKDIMAQESKQMLKPQRYLKNNTVPEIMPLVI